MFCSNILLCLRDNFVFQKFPIDNNTRQVSDVQPDVIDTAEIYVFTTQPFNSVYFSYLHTEIQPMFYNHEILQIDLK